LKAEADQSFIRAGGVRGKFELAENPVFRERSADETELLAALAL